MHDSSVDREIRSYTERLEVAQAFRTIDRPTSDVCGVLVAVKGYDLLALESGFHGTGQKRAMTTGERSAGMFTIISFEPTPIDDLGASETRAPAAVRSPDLPEPRDWAVAGEQAYAICDKAVLRWCGRHCWKLFSVHAYLHEPHSISVSRNGALLLVTATGVDSLLILDSSSGAVTRIWSAADHGYDLSAHETLRSRVRFSDAVPDAAVRDCGAVIELQRSAPRALITGEQTTHVNSAIFHPRDENIILATFFATKALDAQGMPLETAASSGKLVAIHADGHVTELLGGLAHPHSITSLGSGLFAVVNTGRGELLFCRERGTLDLQIIGGWSFASMPGNRRGKEWLQSLKVVNTRSGATYFALPDSARRGIHVLNPQERTRAFVPTPETWAVQNAQVVCRHDYPRWAERLRPGHPVNPFGEPPP
jgi:hypothetical protein